MNRNIFTLVFCLLFYSQAFTQTWNIGSPNAEDIIATLEDGTLTISGTGTMIDFPTYPAPEWRDYRTEIIQLIIENNVTSIGNNAFAELSNLVAVNIPQSVTNIGSYAFSNCTNLSSITIPANVTSIGRYAFQNTGWENNQPEGLMYVNNVLVKYNGTMPANTSITIAEGTTSILAGAFSGCTGLVSVSIPNGITSIESNTFNGCNNLTSAVIPESVTSIGVRAFFGCSKLASIDIPNSVTTLGTDIFRDCISLTSVTLPNKITTLPNNLFWNCSSLESVVIPESVISIGNFVFRDCSKLTSVEIPESVLSTGDNIFQNCSNLTSIEIPEYVTTIGTNMFQDCTNLTSITLPLNLVRGNTLAWLYSYSASATVPASLKTVIVTDSADIKNNFFQNTNLETISMPLVKSIGNSAFAGCKYLTEINIPANMNSIGTSAFSGCTNLTAINVESTNENYLSDNGVLYNKDKTILIACPNKKAGNYAILDGVTTIENSAFANCTDLTSIVIPNTVKTIGNSAFTGCVGLTSMVVPNTVETIGTSAFAGCNALAEITIPFVGTSVTQGKFKTLFNNNVPTSLKKVTITEPCTVLRYDTYEGAFEGCSSLTEINLPNTLITIESDAFSGCSALESITIPENVTAIGDSPFYGCTNLRTLNYNAINCEMVDAAWDALLPGTTNITLNIGDKVEKIPDCAFSSGAYAKTSSLVGTLKIPSSVKSIGRCAFLGCGQLTGTLEIPSSVTSISEDAFRYCSGFTGTLNLSDSLISIGKAAFYGCSGLTSITIGESVTSIEKGAFANCSTLTEVNFNAINTSIVVDGQYDKFLFSGCPLFTTLNIGEKVEVIPAYMFFDCDKITGELIIPNSVTFIGYAFRNCNGLTSVKILGSVVNIGNYAFANCLNLTSVTLHEGIQDIGYAAFLGGENLTSIINLNPDPIEIVSSVFDRVDKSKCTLFVPTGSKTAYKEARYGRNLIL